MPKVSRFMDGKWGCWALVEMDNGDPCYISVAQTGVLVKKTRLGLALFGAKLYEETNVYRAAKTAEALHAQFPDYITPEGINNPVLKTFTNAVLHCSSLAGVVRVLNEAIQDFH